ncbi:hypothetical protein [Roseomonas sp. HF4]|uniref:hypothetical protein n=1 Tax=Roseomonas sp. HF4 TaxID=2562313 RepID=UPI0010C0E5E7|nr:hypothetical protein [Roseomonas sp. HF4]
MTDDTQRPAPSWTPHASRSGDAAHVPPTAPDPWEPVIEPVVGGRVSRSQDICASTLRQVVELRRPDGSVWRAYERHVVLPDDATKSGRVVREATTILALAAGAVAASDTARIARGSDWIADIAAWRGHYGADPHEG